MIEKVKQVCSALTCLCLFHCRLDAKYPICNIFKLFTCAVCQIEMKPGEGVSIHAGTSSAGKLRPWDGPFLCSSCQEKKEAMEGKRGGMPTLSMCVFGVWVGVNRFD